MNFIFGGFHLNVLIGTVISFVTALGVFKLLDHLEGGWSLVLDRVFDRYRSVRHIGLNVNLLTGLILK
ncbi:hypothetical protein ACJJIP_08580 [Microbulbifer sp. VTAC004]|uniref:hypothetical protein n=1 Tax=Microbulbifer sp. VTAC004 TaxID=3243386 RepID=UPI00403A464C